MAEDLLQPLDAYNKVLKDKHHDNTVKYFDELVKKANIDIEANKKTVKDYRNLEADIENLKKKLKWKKFWRVLCCIIFILIFIVFIWLNKQIKALNEQIADMSNKAQKLLDEAWAQMAPLNRLYDWNIPATICNMDTELLHFDKYFTAERFQYLYEAFGLDENVEENVSTVLVQSGEIYGNPFLMCKDYRQDWYDKSYSGSITIHWTTVVHDKNGTRTVHHSQVLTATISKPAPSYGYVTYLVYGNDAAPKLIFSRGPSNATGKNEKEINKIVKKEAKALDKKAKHDLMDNDPKTNYTKLGNDEFEALFGGIDRNNEVEYRLLMTPLAQRNLLQLIKTPEPYGDDFYFNKEKKLNYIQSAHSQKMDYKANPEYFIDYDFETAKNRFITYNDNYFKSFYFDLAPIISIPIYQQQKSLKYIYGNNYKSNITSYEHEVLANSFDRKYFMPEGSRTDAILKTNFVNSNGKVDNVSVTAHSFKTIKRVENVTKIGGDGRMHVIPVEWDEYIPISKETMMGTTLSGASRNGFMNLTNMPQFKAMMTGLGDFTFQRGLFAFLSNGNLTDKQASGIENTVNIDNNSNIENNILNSVNKAIKEAESSVDMNVGNEDSSNQGSN